MSQIDAFYQSRSPFEAGDAGKATGVDEMIVRKDWFQNEKGGLIRYRYDGWFLFGIIPLYIRRFRIG